MSGLLLIFCFIGALITPLDGQQKIIGGQTARIGRAPYAASLRYRGRHYCGGSLIGSRTIVTAAHCVTPYQAQDMTVRIGSNFQQSGGTVAQVSGWRRHPQYNRRTFNFDLALVYLQQAVNFTTALRPIGLYNGRLVPNQIGVILGWGYTRENGQSVNRLQIAKIRVNRRRQCRRAYGRLLHSTMFCAGTPLQIRDACQGDSGGPMVIVGRLAGVISIGNGCGRQGYPGLYTRIPLLRQWIRGNSLR